MEYQENVLFSISFSYSQKVQEKEISNQNYDVIMDLASKRCPETYPDTIKRPELVASATG